jgi:hypothetical protein
MTSEPIHATAESRSRDLEVYEAARKRGGYRLCAHTQSVALQKPSARIGPTPKPWNLVPVIVW